ncbi:MAG: tetratricopeptide repeat protein [Candidatus Omnitrophica bacterium]|nr:tetratricopeptide repeat protein [Candidatus Omnitrophota bacterium]
MPVFIYLDGYSVLNAAMMAESWVYIASIGFFIIFTSCLARLKQLGKILLVSIITFYSFLTAVNNAYWKSDIALYEQIVEYTSEANPVRMNLIDAYLKHGLFDDAIGEINKLVIHYPESPQVNNLLGTYYFLTGQTEKAIDTYKKALDADKKFFYAFYNLSLCYEKTKDPDTAIEYALGCLSINPYFSPNLLQLAELYAKKDEPAESKKYYLMALSLDPDNQRIKDKVKNGK